MPAKVSPKASNAIVRPPEADPVMPAITLVARPSETSGPPPKASSPSRTAAKAGSAATTAPKPTWLEVLRAGRTEALEPASTLSRSAGRRWRLVTTSTTIAASSAVITAHTPPTAESEVSPQRSSPR
jgi:hypothetical protein